MRLRQGCRGWWIAALAAAADRVTKAAALRIPGASLPARRTFRALIPGVVNVRLAANRGMAFSMFSGRAPGIVVVSFALIAGVVTWLFARPDEHRLLRAGLWLIAGGGLGNLFDRLARGYVVDFIELAFVRFAVFNVADVCICAGAALAVIGAMAGGRRERGRARGGV